MLIQLPIYTKILQTKIEIQIIELFEKKQPQKIHMWRLLEELKN